MIVANKNCKLPLCLWHYAAQRAQSHNFVSTVLHSIICIVLHARSCHRFRSVTTIAVFIIVQLHFFIPSFPMPGSSPKLSFMWTSSFASNTFLFFVLFRSMYCQYASMLMFNFSLKFGHALCMQFLVLPSSRSFPTAKEKEHSADKNTVCSFFFFICSNVHTLHLSCVVWAISQLFQQDELCQSGGSYHLGTTATDC